MGGDSFLSRLPRGVVIAIAIGIPVLLIAAVAFAAVNDQAPRRGPRLALRTSPSPTIDSTASPSPDAPLAAASASPASTAAPAPSASISPAASRPVSAPQGASQPAAAAPRKPTGGAPQSTPAPVDCTPSDVTNQLSTDRASYSPGQPVVITVRLTNHSSRDCIYRPSGEDPNYCVQAADGSDVYWSHNHCNTAPSNGLPSTGGAGQPVILKAGATATATHAWNQQQTYPAQPAAPGTYTATGGFDEGASARSATFTLS
ncbi:MAG: hypothetical protein ABR598_03690 [Candidatus Dormibacteria bacterium]